MKLTVDAHIHFRDDCCNPSVYLTVVDVDDWITQCSVFYSNGTVVKSVEIASVYGIVNVSFYHIQIYI